MAEPLVRRLPLIGRLARLPRQLVGANPFDGDSLEASGETTLRVELEAEIV